MGGLRRILRAHRHLALVCALLALALRLALPAGLMLDTRGQTLSVTICADASGIARTVELHLPGKPKPAEHDKAGQACPYAALGMAALAGADPVLLAAALAFLLVLGLTAIPLLPARRLLRLRPPLRAPPVSA